jgi:hypothetical protein
MLGFYNFSFGYTMSTWVANFEVPKSFQFVTESVRLMHLLFIRNIYVHYIHSYNYYVYITIYKWALNSWCEGNKWIICSYEIVTFPPIMTVLGTILPLGSFLMRLYIAIMWRQFNSCLLYSCILFTCKTSRHWIKQTNNLLLPNSKVVIQSLACYAIVLLSGELGPWTKLLMKKQETSLCIYLSSR